MNQREVDVASTFKAAVDRIISLQPDVVLVGGDVFHVVRPTNPAILTAFIQFSRLVTALPSVRVVMVAGNHDLPRTTETGCILNLFARLPRIDVATTEAARFEYPELGLSVLAVPDARPRPSLVPQGNARYKVMLLHGEVEGVIPRHEAMADHADLEISPEELGAHRWDYVALGHYHVYRQVAPNAYYSGSIDYTSANPWGELQEERDARLRGKGFIERDLATGTHVFHHLEPARPLVDLPSVSARGMSAADLDAAIQRAVESCPGGIDDRIVRLIVRDVPRHIARELDHKALREYKRRAFHFHLDTRRPEVVRLQVAGAPGRRQSLAETVREKLLGRVLPSDIKREQLVELGLRYLKEAETLDVTPSVSVANE